MTAISRESVVSRLLVFLYFRVSFISVLSPKKKKRKENWPQIFIFHFSMFRNKRKSNIDFHFFTLIPKKKNLNTNFHFHFSMFRENENWKSLVNFSFLFFKLKKMKIEHRFSFFIFQLSEKMKDPNIHALNPFSNVTRKRKPKNGNWIWIPFSHAIEKRLALSYTHLFCHFFTPTAYARVI